MTVLFSEWLPGLLSDQLTDWPFFRLTDWLIDSMNDWLTDWPASWLTHWRFTQLTNQTYWPDATQPNMKLIVWRMNILTN